MTIKSRLIKLFSRKELLLYLIFIIAGISIIGWLLNNMTLASFSLKYLPIAPSTAATFIILNVLFLWNTSFKKSQATQTIQTLLIVFIALFCLILFFQNMFNLRWDIERIFISNPQKLGNIPEGRMSPVACLMFLFTCIGLLGIKNNYSTLLKYVCGGFTSVVCIASSVLLIGYFYNAPFLNRSQIIPIAYPSAICFLLYGITLLRVFEVRFWVFNLIQDNVITHQLLKWFLPNVIIIVLIQGFLLTNFSNHLINPVLSATLILLIVVLITIFVMIRSSAFMGTRILNSEKELTIAEEKYRTLTESIGEGVCFVNAEEIFIYANPFAEKIFGLGKGELTGLSLNNFLQNENLEIIKNETLKRSQGERSVYELGIILTDGSNKDLLVTATPRFDDNKFIGTFSIFHDITERKQAEKLRSLSNEILGILSKNLSLETMIADVLKSIQRETKFSAAGIRLNNGEDFPYYSQTGFSEDFLRTENTLTVKDRNGGICRDKNGNVLLECTCGMVLSAKKDLPNPLLTSGGTFWTNNSYPLLKIPVEEDRRLHPRNKCIHLGYGSVALIPILADEKIVGLLQLNDKKEGVFTNDIISFFEGICSTIGTALLRKQSDQKLKLKNEELEKLNAEINKYFAIIAHDLRSPFNTFLGLTRMMTEKLPSMELAKIQEIAVMMKASATNLYSLLENLLEWAQSQRGETNFNPVSFSLSPKISNNLLLIQESVYKKEIKMSVNIPEDLVVYADENMLGCIIRNFSSNSMKFTPKGGKITIAANPISENTVEISIKDTGIGMNKEMIENLFRLDGNSNRKGTDGEPSTGLGLIICKEFIEKHKGKIWVESEEGKGTTFYFTLPTKIDGTLN
jgi:PAS domain S-box-containing protein